MSEKPVVNSVYEHINNGGVSFQVTNEGGPTLEIKATHFGHITNSMKLHMTKESLRNLAQMFAAAAGMEYGPEYVCATTSNVWDRDTGKTVNRKPNGSQGALGREGTEN